MQRLVNKIGKDIVATPDNVVDEMLDLLPDSVWNKNTKFLDPVCKTGIFLYKIRDRLMKVPELISEYPNEKDRARYIVENQLYAICWNKNCADESRNNLHGRAMIEGNIHLVENLYKAVKAKDNGEVFRAMIKEQFGDMKFDVIVGNPPYNNDIYIKFIINLYMLSSDYMLMITPAKWQAKGGPANISFRDRIIPIMSDIVYYPDAFEIFDIREQEGITYFLTDKAKHNIKNIKVKCKKNSYLESDEQRTDVHKTLYGSKISTIIDKCSNNNSISKVIGVKQSEFVANTESGKKTGAIPVYAGDKLSGYVNATELRSKAGIDKYKVTTSVMPVDVGFDKNGQMFGLSKTYIIEPNTVPKGSFPVLMKFDTLKEAESFQSYCNCKLIRFLYFIGICGKTISEEFWRFIPDQGVWNHIFTDKELYDKYRITPDEINIINKVIKDRA